MRTMRTLSLVALLALVPATAIAGIPPGTELVGNLDQQLSSQDAEVGERFTISSVHSQDNDIHDAVIYGHVASVVRAGQGRPGKLELAYDKVHTLSGNSYALDGITSQAQTNTKTNAGKEVLGAVGGMLVGNMLGKTLLHTGGGGIVGAAGGFLYAKNNRENVVIPQHAVITVSVTRSRIQPAIR